MHVVALAVDAFITLSTPRKRLHLVERLNNIIKTTSYCTHAYLNNESFIRRYIFITRRFIHLEINIWSQFWLLVKLHFSIKKLPIEKFYLHQRKNDNFVRTPCAIKYFLMNWTLTLESNVKWKNCFDLASVHLSHNIISKKWMY